ncbi:MAG: hypothetical protein V7709_13845 [Halioglobus sp.]
MIPEFSGTRQKYIRLSAWMSAYSIASVYLLFALTKYLTAADSSYFSWTALGLVCMLIIAYFFVHLYVMSHYDGTNRSGSGWSNVATSVKLPQRKRPRKFG